MNNTNELLQNILLGGVLGLIGQGVRVFAGLKKLSESKKTDGDDSFDTRRLMVSLLLGFLAGAIGVLTLVDDTGTLILVDDEGNKKSQKDVWIKLVAIGYAGVDFLEAFLTKYIPATTGAAAAGNADNAAAGAAAGNPVTPPTRLVATLPYSSK